MLVCLQEAAAAAAEYNAAVPAVESDIDAAIQHLDQESTGHEAETIAVAVEPAAAEAPAGDQDSASDGPVAADDTITAEQIMGASEFLQGGEAYEATDTGVLQL